MCTLKSFYLSVYQQDSQERVEGDADGDDYDIDNSGGSNDDNNRGDHSEAVDAQGIPGWDKVDTLVRALNELRGHSISNEEPRNIWELYRALDEFDKRTRTFSPCPWPAASRGRFRGSKRGHTNIDQMKR